MSFQSGDNARFDDTSANRTITIAESAKVSVGTLLIVTDKTDYKFQVVKSTKTRLGTVTEIRKQGSGSVVFTEINGDQNYVNGIANEIDYFYVESGSVTFADRHMLHGACTVASQIRVASGAELHFLSAGTFMNTYSESDPLKMVVDVAKGGKFSIDGSDLTAKHHGVLGPLILNDGLDFDFTKPLGYGKAATDPGLLTFSGKIEMNGSKSAGTNPYNWDILDFQNQQQARFHLWDIPLTEFCVADVTGDNLADFTTSVPFFDRCPEKGKLWAAGFVKSGEGTMAVTNRNNAFSGNVEIRGGTLCVGPDLGENLPLNPMSFEETQLGALTNDAKTVTAFDGGVLYFPNRNIYGVMQAITNDGGPRCTFVFDGGLLRLREEQVFFLPNMTFSNGGFVEPGIGLNNGYGRFMVREHFKVLASERTRKPFVWEAVEGNLGFQGLALNGFPENVLTIEDATGDAAPDADFRVPIMVGYYFKKAGYEFTDHAFSFTKRGAGTLRYAAPNLGKADSNYRTFNGDAKIVEGTFQVDGDIALSDTVRISTDAFLAGTGSVNNVSIANGGGLRVPWNQIVPLQVVGNLEIGENPVIDVVASEGFDSEKLSVKVLRVSGTVRGENNLEDAIVKVDGVALPNMRARIRNGVLTVGMVKGLAIILR